MTYLGYTEMLSVCVSVWVLTIVAQIITAIDTPTIALHRQSGTVNVRRLYLVGQ